MKRFSRLMVVVLAWVSMIALACNLTSPESNPPTLMPRITDQVLPTLGYDTPIPDQNQVGGATATPPPPIGAQLHLILNQVETDRLMLHIEMLQGFHTRHANSTQSSETEGVGAAFKYLYGQFEQISRDSNGNFQAFAHPFRNYYNGVETVQNNVVGVINGTEPNTPVIVLGAHYDSRTDDLRDSTAFAPGADDNGSGTAAVIEIARIMSQFQPRATIIFVLFAAEEVNRQGSRAFIRDYIQQYSIPVGVMINLDTIGSNNAPNNVYNDGQMRLFSIGDDENAPSREMARMIDFINFNNNTGDLEVVKVDAADREGRYGDHFSFTEAGYPAVRFIEAVEDTPNREGRDTIEHVEPDYLRRSTRTVLTVVIALADGPRPPANITLRDLNNGSRRLVWEQVQGAAGYVVALRRPGETYFAQRFPAPGQLTAYDFDGFVSTRYTSLAVAAIDENGIMGPLSEEFPIP